MQPTLPTGRGSARRFRPILLAGAAMVANPGYAEAQEAAAEAEAASDDGDVIVVTGTRPIAESEAAALEIQKNYDSLVTVAAADSVGRLPDQNIAQATSRLPGVSVERDQGQARYINLRGAPKTWTTLSFDGINVVSPEGRDARFDSIPSAIAGKIIVSKAVTPDMPGETVAGNVNVITRSAFDYSGLHAAGKAGMGFAELGDKKEYEGALVLSDRFQAGDGEIGVLVSGSWYERNMITDNFETDYERVPRDLRPGKETRFWAHEAENKLYRLTRRNWSVSGRLDWKPDADNTVVAPVDRKQLVDDTEGLAIAPVGRTGGYLVASSQGDNAYALFRLPDYRPAGRVRVVAGKLGSTEETDGIAIAMGNFGKDFPAGLFVVQDGDNAPAAQNFKLVSWRDVLRAVGRR